MTLPVSGTISLDQVNVELGFVSASTISLNQAAVRSLFGKPSGTISLSDGYSKSSVFTFNPTIGTTQNYNLKAAAIAAGWDQASPLVTTVTISSGAIVGSSSTGAYAFDTGASFPTGSSLTLIISSTSYIVGCGGSIGGAGGPALRAQHPIAVYNNGVIGGGGGSGGEGYIAQGGVGVGSMLSVAAGGGAGNNAGYGYQGGNGGANASGGGSLTAGGGGATGYNNPPGAKGTVNAATGGNGGGLGTQGGSGHNVYYGTDILVPGGAGGAAVVGNGNITWAVVGTRYGTIS